MKKYRISKKGWSSNTLAPLSTFGDTREFFEGYSETPPTVGERFTLYGKDDISTSVVTEVKEGLFTTIYSQYYFEEYED